MRKLGMVNLVDILVILFLVGLFAAWMIFKRKKAKENPPSRCAGCANFGLCSKKKDNGKSKH